MDNKELLQLYDITIKEGQYYLNSYEKRVTFFWKIVSAIFGGLIVGIFKATMFYHFIILIIAPILLFFIVKITKETLSRAYLSFLECVTIRAKIESDLNLNTPKNYKDLTWENESITPSRYIITRNKYNTSEEFVNNTINSGIQPIYMSLFNIIQIVSILLTVFLIILAIKSFI